MSTLNESIDQTTAQQQPLEEGLTLQQKEAQAQEFVEKLTRAGQKLLIFTPPLSQVSKQALEHALTTLEKLNTKIILIGNQVVAQSKHLSDRVTFLRDQKVIKLNIDLAQSEQSVAQYTYLLGRILEEIDYEKDRLSKHLGLQEQTALTIWKHEPGTFDEYIRFISNQVKKQIKRIEKDLHVSFSRYQFSFENHRKRLDQIEALLAYNGALPTRDSVA